jgi:hypothetical protein
VVVLLIEHLEGNIFDANVQNPINSLLYAHPKINLMTLVLCMPPPSSYLHPSPSLVLVIVLFLVLFLGLSLFLLVLLIHHSSFPPKSTQADFSVGPQVPPFKIQNYQYNNRNERNDYDLIERNHDDEGRPD